MFRNLKAEIAREGFKPKDIANVANISERSFSNRMVGKAEFTRNEMLKIHKTFFPSCTFEYLFDMSEQGTT